MFVAAGGRCGDAKLPVTMYETTTKSDGRIAYNKSAAGGIAVATQICCATATCQTFLCRHHRQHFIVLLRCISFQLHELIIVR
jgi:hypothetical protein